MADYQLIEDGSVIRASDGACIPRSADNRDWLEFQNWCAQGNEPDPVSLQASFSIEGASFLARFTDPEYTAILNAAETARQQSNGQLSRWIDMLRMRGAIDVSGTAAQAAKAAVVAASLLTPARADVIFAPAS